MPWFDDVTSDAGWQGHATSKSIRQLQSEVTEALGRLGGMVMTFQRGKFQTDSREREGFRLHYTVSNANGEQWPGKVDIAALPVKPYAGYDKRKQRGFESRKEQSLKMALFMTRIALNGAWYLEQLSPGYAPLVPWMIADGEHTITELWSSNMQLALPAGDEDFVEGEFTDNQ